MRKMWLYLGILLACSGIATGFGVLLIVVYFWEDIKKFIWEIQEKPEPQFNSQYYDADTAQKMR